MKNKRKGFTIIELLVVIAVVAILVLLAVLGISNYIEKAKVTRIQNDVRAVENVANAYHLEHGEYDTDGIISIENLKEKASQGNFYTKKGKEETIDEDKTYQKLSSSVTDEANSSLPGDFIIDDDGNAGYIDEGKGGSFTENEESEESEPITEDEISKLIGDGYVPVATAEELQHIASNSSTPRTFGQGTKWEDEYVGELDSKFIQVKNIDLFSIDNFKPIGDNSTENNNSRFSGTYNGGNYKINSLKIDRTNETYVGLFGYISGATIENMGLEEANVKGGYATGGLIGYIISYPNPSLIKNSYVKGNVTSFGQSHAGGLVGSSGIASENSKIENSYTMTIVKVVGGDILGSTGGLVGRNNNIDISNSYATGSVSGRNNTGGLVGENKNSTISDSYATGYVKGKEEHTGGFVGQNINSIIENSYATGYVTGSGDNTGGLAGGATGSEIKDSYAEGKVTGKRSTGGLIGKTTSAKIKNSYAIGNVNGMNYTGGLVGFNGENTTIEKSHAIGTVEGTSQTGGLVGTNFRAYISNSYATGDVTGTESDVGGLAGNNHQGGIIDNSYATGNVTGNGNTGGLVGHNQTEASIISDSYATGSVIGKEDDTGGLAGKNSGSISNSHATGDSVNGEGINTGGLVGTNFWEATIENSYSTANVTGKDNTGGLVGDNDNGTIRNSYAKGVVSGEKIVGGLVGKHMGYSNFIIEKSYSTGKVNGTSSVGSLLGLMSNQSGNTTKVENSYALENADLPLVGTKTLGNRGSLSRNVVTNSSLLSDSGMKDENNYNNWDFTNIWEITPGNYPTLR